MTRPIIPRWTVKFDRLSSGRIRYEAIRPATVSSREVKYPAVLSDMEKALLSVRDVIGYYEFIHNNDTVVEWIPVSTSDIKCEVCSRGIVFCLTEEGLVCQLCRV